MNLTSKSIPNILVVGGAGYIGSHTCLSLLEKNYAVTVFDNLCRGNKWWKEEVLFINGDIRSTSDVSKLFSKNKYDLVMHFAALAYVGESISDPNLYYDTNVTGTINLLSSMLKHNVNNFVFSSSCAVYGSPNTKSIDESIPLNPVNPYGKTKKIIEDILSDYNDAYNLNSISLRYFNAAGCDPLGRVHENHSPERI